MPRKVRDAALDTRTARSRLKVSHTPYMRLLEPELHLAYRKLPSGPGTWGVRRYAGAGKYSLTNLRTDDGRVVIADDYGEADGRTIMTFAQAQDAAKGKKSSTAAAGSFTVADAMDDYLTFLEGKRRTASDARYRDAAFIRPELGAVRVEALTADRLRRWLDKVAEAPVRLRTRKGEAQKFKEAPDDDEAHRRRQSTANRTWTVLKAALNMAWRAGKVSDDSAWRRVKPFEGVDSARVRYLQVAEAKRLLNACAADFRKVVQGALVTGARYGQLGALVAGDFNPDSGTVTLRSRKGGRGKVHVYHCVLTKEGQDFFTRSTAGLASGDIVFRKADGEQWGKSHQARLMTDVCEAAKIAPAIGFHILRHTWASLAIMNGTPLVVVAENLGHADTRMVSKHYGHLAPSYKADAIRAGAPTFGIKADKKVAVLATR